MNAATWASLGAVIAAIFASIVSFIAARRSHKLETTKVDLAAYDRAKEFTDGLIEALRKEVERLNQQVDRMRKEIEQEEQENQLLRQQVNELSKTANNLRYEISVLQTRLRGQP